VNQLDLDPYLAQERRQQMLREVNALRLQKRLRDNHESSGSRFFALARRAHCRCCAEQNSPSEHEVSGR
jgi:hypothetical protein